MATIPEVKYEVKNKKIILIIPLTSQGKFRCKKRANMQDFGNGFAPKSTIITSDAYLEWQIGYDTIIGKDEKNTSLNTDDFIFIGANKKCKHPYELSEIVFSMCKEGIILKNELDEVLSKISSINEYLQDKYTIETKKESEIKINNLKFLSSSTTLPTFVLEDEETSLIVEIMIQKQQYATGTNLCYILLFQ